VNPVEECYDGDSALVFRHKKQFADDQAKELKIKIEAIVSHHYIVVKLTTIFHVFTRHYKARLFHNEKRRAFLTP
jgi:hypothetical protein